MAKDPYKVLGVSYNVTLDDVRVAFRQRARSTHPDNGGSSDDFITVQNAYKTILRHMKAKAEAEREKAQAFNESVKKTQSEFAVHAIACEEKTAALILAIEHAIEDFDDYWYLVDPPDDWQEHINKDLD